MTKQAKHFGTWRVVRIERGSFAVACTKCGDSGQTRYRRASDAEQVAMNRALYACTSKRCKEEPHVASVGPDQ